MGSGLGANTLSVTASDASGGGVHGDGGGAQGRPRCRAPSSRRPRTPRRWTAWRCLRPSPTSGTCPAAAGVQVQLLVDGADAGTMALPALDVGEAAEATFALAPLAAGPHVAARRRRRRRHAGRVGRDQQRGAGLHRCSGGNADRRRDARPRHRRPGGHRAAVHPGGSGFLTRNPRGHAVRRHRRRGPVRTARKPAGQPGRLQVPVRQPDDHRAVRDQRRRAGHVLHPAVRLFDLQRDDAAGEDRAPGDPLRHRARLHPPRDGRAGRRVPGSRRRLDEDHPRRHQRLRLLLVAGARQPVHPGTADRSTG